MTRIAMAASLALSTALAGPVLAQATSQNFKIDGSDLSYGRNAGYTYEIVTITVTDAAGFRVDASNVVTTGTPTGAISYALFPTGTPVPAGVFDWRNHRDDPNTVAAGSEGTPNTTGPRRLPNRANGPLTAGEYQLVIAPNDRRDRRGDYDLDLDLTGGFFGTLVTAPPPGGGSEALAELAAGSSAAARLLVLNAQGVARTQASASLLARDAALSFTRTDEAEGPVVVASTRNVQGLAGNIFAWAEVTGFYATDDAADRNFRGYGVQIGADMGIGPDMVLGLSLGVDDISAAAPGFNQDGTLVFLQPYLAYRSGNWHGEATLVYGQGDFDQTGPGGDGSGETELMAATFEGGYDIAHGANRTITPMMGLVVGREEITGTGGVLAGTGSETVQFTQLSLGARVSQEMGAGEFFYGFHADWLETDADTALVADLLTDDGVSARVEIGGRWDLGGGRSLDTSFELGGLGGDVTTVTGGLRAVFRF